MAQREVVLPSGMRLQLRGLKVKDFGLLSDDELARSGRSIGAVLSACTISTPDWGPYNAETFDWNHALLGDQMVAMIEARIATHGINFDFDVKCPACGDKIRWRIDLTKLERRTYTPEAIAAFKSELAGGKPLQVEVGGRMLGFRAVTVEVATDAARSLVERTKAIREARREAKRSAKRKGRRDGGEEQTIDKMNALLEGLVARVVSVDGVEPGGIRDWLDEMDLGDLTALRRVSDEHDGGVETSTLVECQNDECKARSEVELPLDRQQFWLAAT